MVVLIILTAIPYGTVDPWSEAVFECAIFSLTLLGLIQGFLQGSWRVGRLYVLPPLIAITILAIIQSIPWSHTEQRGIKVVRALSADLFESHLFALRTSALFLAAILVSRTTSTLKRLVILVNVIIALVTVTALFGIARQTLQHSDGFILMRLKPNNGFAQFINKNHFAYQAEMAFGLIAGIVFLGPFRKERILIYLSALLAICAGLVMSLSRGGLLAITCQIIIAAMMLVSLVVGRQRRLDQRSGILRFANSMIAKAVVTLVLLAAIAVGVLWLGGDQLVTGVETANTEMVGVDPSQLHEAARRRDIWRLSWRMFTHHPLVGAGLGGYWAEVPIYHEGSGVLAPQQAHNDYLEILASAGLIGLGILIWFAVALYKQGRSSISSAEGVQHAIVLGAIVSLAGVAIHSLVDFGLHITINALVFMVVVSILSLKAFPAEASAADELRTV